MVRQMLTLIVVIALLCLGSASAQRPDVCDQPPTLTGPCTDYKTRWFFHKDLNECIMFDWGGCQETENLFESLQQCESLCLGIGEVLPTDT